MFVDFFRGSSTLNLFVLAKFYNHNISEYNVDNSFDFFRNYRQIQIFLLFKDF